MSDNDPRRNKQPEPVHAGRRAPIVIRFFAPLIPLTISQLMGAIDSVLANGGKEINLLISSPGGTVDHGLSAYNYLKGIPAKVITHNFGVVDSISGVLYCSGDVRLTSPQARFLIHGVGTGFPPNAHFDEKGLTEKLATLKMDTLNIARVIAANTNKTEKEVYEAMLEGTILDANQAIEWGIAHEIKQDLFDSGAQIISIEEAPPAPQDVN